MKTHKTLILNTAAVAVFCGATLAGLPALAAGTKAAPAVEVSIDSLDLRVDGVKGLVNSSNSFNAYVNPYMRLSIKSSTGVTITTDIDLTKITSGDTLRTDGDLNHIIHRLAASYSISNSQSIMAGLTRVAFGPDKNADEDGRTIFGNGQNKLTNLDERLAASYQFQLEGATITASIFSSASAPPPNAGSKVSFQDLMDPRLGKSGDISGAVKASRDLGDLSSILKDVKASVSYAWVRQDGKDSEHRFYAELNKNFNIGKVAIEALASYAHIMNTNASDKDVDSWLAYAHATYGNSPWGLYCQFDRTDGENRIEGGVDYSQTGTMVNTKVMVGVFADNFTESDRSVGLGASASFSMAQPLSVLKVE